jgi:type VI secretion system secreted protein Hcp
MKPLRFLLLAIGIGITAVLTAPQAAGGLVLKLDGIPGDSEVAGHKAEIDIQSLTFGVSQTGIREAGGKASARRSSLSPITVTKEADASSPKLFLACATGTHIPKAVITFFQTAQAGGPNYEYLTITLTDVLISGYSLSSGGDFPSESVSLSYTKIEYKYVGKDPSGQLLPPVIVTFDVQRNRELVLPE